MRALVILLILSTRTVPAFAGGDSPGSESKCNEKEQRLIQEQSCDEKSAVGISAACLVTSRACIAMSLQGSGQFIYAELAVAVKTPARQLDKVDNNNFTAKTEEFGDRAGQPVPDWWASTSTAEDRSSRTMDLVAHVGAKELKSASRAAHP
jgi:hypothetical protein